MKSVFEDPQSFEGVQFEGTYPVRVRDGRPLASEPRNHDSGPFVLKTDYDELLAAYLSARDAVSRLRQRLNGDKVEPVSTTYRTGGRADDPTENTPY